jgi:RNA polymerase sigma factor (sigma-70 family)
MPETAVNRENGQCLELVDQQNAARKLQDVLTARLPYFYRCAFRMLENAADAEDAVQEALLAAYKHIDQFRGQSQVSTWFTTIVRNCALMQLRKRQRQIHFSLDKEFGEEQPRFSLGMASHILIPAATAIPFPKQLDHALVAAVLLFSLKARPAIM